MNYEDIFQRLNISRENGLFYFREQEWNNNDIFSYETKKIINDKLKPYAFFVFNQEPLLLFFKNIQNSDFKNIWNFNKSAIVFDLTESTLTIYNGFDFITKHKKLNILADDRNLSDFDFFSLVTGETFEKYKNKLKKQNRVDEILLKNIKYLKKILIEKHKLSNEIANNLIGRIIFTRYLIDRNVEIKFNGKQTIINNEKFINILNNHTETYKFFEYLQSKFKGNLFPIGETEKQQVTYKVLQEIITFLNETELENNQTSFFKFYDFSIIPVELISNVYEFFIGQSGQEKQGAYYTPIFLVEYILNDTVKEYFIDNPTQINCKVLDPSCGSGIFLVQTLRKIIEQYQKNNPDFSKNETKYKNDIKNLLKQNIFGIDSDESAISVAIFSLYLTLLDYLTPPEIVDFEFPEVLNTNLFHADFFNKEAEYNNILKSYNFEFILGNPPWGEVGTEKSVELYEKYWKERQKQENKEIKVSDKQIAEVFLIRVSDFTFKETAFVITSKILYKVGSKNEFPKIFRKYFTTNFKIRKIFELSSVRQYIFDKSNDPAQASAAVLFYSHETNIDKIKSNIVTHISLKPNRFFKMFKTFLIEKQDVKELRQEYFIENDWIWKVLVYGNMLDYYFIKRLKKNYEPIKNIIKNNTEFIISSGIKKIDGKNKNDVSNFIEYNFLDTKILTSHKIPNNLDKFQNILKSWKQEYWVGYKPIQEKEIIFEPISLLFKDGKGDNFRSISAINYNQNIIFKDSITSIKILNQSNIKILKSISAIFSSIISSYIAVIIDSSCGIDRYRTKPNEHLSFPFVTSEELVNMTTKIEEIAKKQNQSNDLLQPEKQELEKQFKLKQDEIDQEVIKLFKLDEEEKDLLDYAYNISIPMIKNKKFNSIFRELKYNDKDLEEYAKIFIDSFNRTYNSDGNYFEVEIWWTKYIIGMKFKVILEKSQCKNQIIWKKGQEVKEILQNIGSLQFSEVTNDIFIQKDLRGFEEDYFYIIKPNEYKSWHKAVAHNDLREIDNDIMLAAKEELENG